MKSFLDTLLGYGAWLIGILVVIVFLMLFINGRDSFESPTLSGAVWELVTGWTSNPESHPRYKDKGFIDVCLVGQQITTAKGIIFNDYWTIRQQEVSDFKVVSIKEDTIKNRFTATVSFNATANGRGLRVKEGLIRYGYDPATNKLNFIEFVPKQFEKFGF